MLRLGPSPLLVLWTSNPKLPMVPDSMTWNRALGTYLNHNLNILCTVNRDVVTWMKPITSLLVDPDMLFTKLFFFFFTLQIEFLLYYFQMLAALSRLRQLYFSVVRTWKLMGSMLFETWLDTGWKGNCCCNLCLLWK